MTWRRIRFTLAVLALFGAFAFGLVESQEAVAVAPCQQTCTDPGNCAQKCVCDTPEWGPKVTWCNGCPWISNNACSGTGGGGIDP